jgi:hypothetical protein
VEYLLENIVDPKGVKGRKFGETTNRLDDTKSALTLNMTSHVTFPFTSAYAIDRAWLTVYFMAVATMLLSAISSLFVRTRCRAPVILGFASSLISDSMYFAHYGVYNNSTEDGSERSKRLGKLKVMVANVRVEPKDRDKIAFAPAELGERIEKGRWCD